MLDHAKLLAQIQNLADSFFVAEQYDYALLRSLWDWIGTDPTHQVKLAHAPSVLQLPTWSSQIQAVYEVPSNTPLYTAIAVDGSQVYPDRHQGIICYLLNIGSTVITYGGQGAVQFRSQPYVFTGNDADQLRLTSDLVDCRRQEYEMSTGIDVYNNSGPSTNTVVLFDGSLIFWHLNNQSPELKDYFLTAYMNLLEQWHCLDALVAWYISVPKNKDLVNVLRYLVDDKQAAERAKLDQLVDTTLAATFLQPYQRTIAFACGSAVCVEYPPHLVPHFLYVHVGSEIVRLEIPAWIAIDDVRVDVLVRRILDQVIKGRGYPVVLAEAHEQAVVKGPDRDFFYHILAKLSVEHQRPLAMSPKNIKKRGIGI